MTDPKEILSLDDRLRSRRANLMVRWQEIAELIAPHEADFTITRSDGQLRGLQQYESAPAVAAENLAGGLWALLTNPATQWFTLKASDPGVMEDADAAAWLDSVRDIIMRELDADGGAFYARTLDMDRALVRYGTGLLYRDTAPNRPGLRFWAPPVRECVIQEDDEGRVDFVSRRFKWSARQAFARWGQRTPEKVRKALEKAPEQEFTFVHAVRPNRDRVPGRRDMRGKPWHSCYVLADDPVLVEEGGMDRNPWVVGRWARMQASPYGYSPAMVALADTKTLNVMAKTFLVSSQKAADPPLLAPDENAIMPIRVRPGGIVYGAVNANGQALVQALETRGAFTLTDAMMQAKREAVRAAFLAAQLEMPDRPNRTATEVLQREEDRMRMMAPNLVRMQSDVLDPIIEGIFEDLQDRGVFPPAPSSLGGQTIQVEYVSPLARAQRASEGQALLRVFESIAPLAAMRPDVLDNFDIDQASRLLAQTLGAPGTLLRDPRKVIALRQAQADAARQAQEADEAAAMVDAAPKLAGAAASAEKAPGVLAALGMDLRAAA